MGGSGEVSQVLNHVQKLMADILGDIDYDALPSDPRNVRWRDTAQWERQAMVDDGLIAPVRRRGTWEITDLGRQYLDEHDAT
jgi:hypothetical protein